MATYNGGKYIKKQLESVLANLSSADQVVISDDGSTDDTLEIIKSFNDNRIQVLLGSHKGINQNFATAIQHCEGDYIFLCDQDDVWNANKVDRILNVFRTTDCILVLHDAIIVNQNNDLLYPSFFSYRNMHTGIVRNWLRNCYHGCLMAFRKQLIRHILPIPSAGCLHDQWIGIIAEMYGKVIFHDEILMKYYRREDNASSFSHLPRHIQFRDRWILMCYLSKYIIKYRKGFTL